MGLFDFDPKDLIPKSLSGALDSASSGFGIDPTKVRDIGLKMPSVSSLTGGLTSGLSGVTGSLGGLAGGLSNGLPSMGGGTGLTLPNFNNLTAGAASVLGKISSGGVSFDADMGLENLAEDVVSSLFKSWDTDGVVGGPPYPNILEEFASYAPLWTLACLTPNQANDPYTYRNNSAALENIVFSSAGRFGGKRVQLMEGKPEYYINNFNMRHQCAGDPAMGMSNQVSMSFEVFEPYSMGLLLQSLQAAAINSGYPNYNGVPYVLKLEFFGYRDDGSMFNPSSYLTKYFVIMFKDIQFTTNEGGSNYKVEAVPWNSNGWITSVQNLYTATNLTAPDGKTTVADLLSKGTNSLAAALNKQQQDKVGSLQNLPDHFSIVFPTDYADRVGLQGDPLGQFIDSLTVSVEESLSPGEEVVVEANIGFDNTEDVGYGEIGASDMGFDSNTGGNYTFSLAGDAVGPNGTIVREQMVIDPKSRTFSFKEGSLIQNVISQIVLSSQYAKDALDPNNLINGFIKWFRVDVQVELGALDLARGEFAKKYIYRVVPYLVHSSVFKNPTSPAAGKEELNRVIAKRYNYIYTGQNNDVLKFDIQINNLFKAGLLPRPAEDTESEQNVDGNAPTDDPGNKAEAVSGTDVASLAATNNATGAPDRKATRSAAKGGYGAKNVKELVVAQMYNAILNNGKREGGDLIEVELEILGDPYWMIDEGMGNYLGESFGDPVSQITPQSTMNYQGTDTFIKLIFRTPVEPNLGTTGVGGLYNFQYGGIESPFSGIYKVTFCTNKFSDGAFRQVLSCKRMPFEEESRRVNILDVFLTDTSKPDKASTSTFDPNTDEWGDLDAAIAAQTDGVMDPSDPDSYGEG